jgi:hypothetical protein
MSLERARDEIAAHAGSQFDSDVTGALWANLPQRPGGEFAGALPPRSSSTPHATLRWMLDRSDSVVRLGHGIAGHVEAQTADTWDEQHHATLHRR